MYANQMETFDDQPNLRCFLADRIPEGRSEFMALPGEVSINATLYTFYEVTAELAHQYKFRAVKRCLLVAEELYQDSDNQVSNAVCSIYLVHLSKLLDKRNVQSELIYYLLPRILRAEYRRQLSTCLPFHHQ